MNNHFLENYKVRRRKKLWPKILEVITFLGFFAIVDFVVLKLHIDISGYILIIGNLAAIVLTIYLFRTQLFEKLKPKEFFSAGFDFRQPDDETISAAIEGIFSFSKSQPHFIHVTPPNEEIKQIFNALGEGGSNFIHIYGKPGEGKSMLAYHAIYQRERKFSTKCYSLKVDTIVDKSKDIIKDILNELDGLPCMYNAPVLKLILIDDAHRLPFAYELEKQLRIEASQGNGRFIWITTDLDPFEKTKRKTGELSINFQAYYLHLVSTLYRSEDLRILKLMAGRFPKLDLVIAQTKENRIRDAWTFNFVASDGFAKLKEDILKLKEEEKYILYLLSAHTSIKGEEPLPVSEFYNLCVKFNPHWFQLPYVEFEKTLRALFEQKPEDASTEKRRMMLHLSEDSQKNVSAESLHFLFATNYLREASRTFLDYKRKEMLNAVQAILNNDWKKFRYLTSFLKNIGNDVGMFFEQNAEWMKMYFEHLQPSHFDQYGHIIRFLHKFNKSLFAEIFTDDYFHRHSSFFSQLPVTRLAALAHFICALPSEMKDKLVVQLDAIALSNTISKVTIQDFGQAAAIINAFGNRKEVLLNELIEKKKLTNIIEEISKATIENFEQAAAIINAFGNRKEVLLNELIENKKLTNIIEEISKATIENFEQAAAIINAFGMEIDKVISQINFNLLNKQVNEWQAVALIQTSKFVKALESKAAKLLLPFCEEKFLSLSYQIKGHDIIAFLTILSKLPAAEQLSAASKILWLELLNKSPRSHFFHLNNITRIMHFYLRSRSSGPVEEVRKPLLEYLRINREDIKKMFYNTQSKNYSAFYNSILILAGIDLNETACIIRESINGFCKRFKVFPEITTYVSRLLYLFYSIDLHIAFKIICHETVNHALKDFLRSERIHENPDGTKALIKAVRNSNKRLWQEEFIKDEKISLNLSNYDLSAIYEEQDEDRKQINAVGLEYFKIDAVDQIETNIEDDESEQKE